jgi:hypothetical protein
MHVGVLDLAIVTDQLLAQLRAAKHGSRLWTEEPTRPPFDPTTTPAEPEADTTPMLEFDILFTGMPPDAARALGGECKVSLYLFHIAPDKYYRATYPADPRDTSRAATRPRQIPQQPLALTLYYLLSAHSESYIQEQQAMSIALKSFHENPIVTALVPTHTRQQEFTVTMEPQTVDEIGRLWQSFASALRLSAVYRASVVFLEPEQPTKPIPGVVQPDGWTVSAYPQFIVSRAIVSPTGAVTVWGRKFTDPSLEVRVDGVKQNATANTPPLAGDVHIVDATQLELQLPAGTRKGVVRLGVKVDSEALEAVFTIKVPADIT